VQLIDGSAFIDVNLDSISFEGGNSTFNIDNHLLIDIIHHTLIRNFSTSLTLEIPHHIEILGSSCFGVCESLSSIIFEADSRLKRIESMAFSKSSLQSIVLPRSVEILGSSCFRKCESLSSITFESESRLKRIAAQVLQNTNICSVVIPPTVSYIASDAFPEQCLISVLDCSSCPDLDRWCTERQRDSTAPFRQLLRLGSGLPCLSECLLDLSMFERVQPLGIGDEHLSELYRRLSDGLEIVVKLNRRLDVEQGDDCWTEIEIENEIEKLLNLRHPCIVAPLGFVVSSNWTELKVARVYGRCGSLEEVLQTSPSWWTATVKSIAVASIALGLRFVQIVGLVCGNLKPSNILFDESHRISLVNILPSRTESHRQAGHHGRAERESKVPSKSIAPQGLSGERLTEKADVFSFASILLSIVLNSPFEQTDEWNIAGHPIPESVPQFVYELIESGISTNPHERPTMDENIVTLERNNFRIAEEVDSEQVLAFVSSVQLSEL
jgi:hypothetical protein